jgi:hypothetical protein
VAVQLSDDGPCGSFRHARQVAISRIAGALSQLGASARAVRIVRWVTRWLLFGFPGLVNPVIGVKHVSLARLETSIELIDLRMCGPARD